jgi:hypothetical protein
MEFSDLIGAQEEQDEHEAALDAMESLLKQLDARTRRHGAARAGGRRGRARRKRG